MINAKPTLRMNSAAMRFVPLLSCDSHDERRQP